MINFKGATIEFEKIIDFLKQEMLLKEISQKLLYQKIINNAIAERNIKVTPEEIQAECNYIRYDKRLEKVSDTLAWLEEQMLTSDDWETSIRNRLSTKKLAEHLFESEVEKYFAQHRLDFDEFVLYQIIVSFEPLAREICYQIEEKEISFYEAAHFYDLNEKRRNLCGYEGKVKRWSFSPDIAAFIFKTPVPIGEVLGPIKTNQGYHLFMIEEFIQAKLNSQTSQEIINKFFQEWMNNEINHLLHPS
jgi:parvulin-like peptidyl-prolyl isomerase